MELDKLDRQSPKKEKFLEIFELSGCNISLSCKKGNIARQTFYNWYDSDEKFRNQVDDMREGLLDLAESMLMRKVREGSTTELIFYLKTKGKKRGYVERQEYSGADGSPIVWQEVKTYKKDENKLDDIDS
jgi:hypothetical protein